MSSKKPDVRVDFFCIGAAKSATTWLSDCLKEHPRIELSAVKEPNFFCKRVGIDRRPNPAYIDDWDWYASLFNHANPDQIRGDFSINLFHNIETAPALLHHHFPKARLVLMLRDPVERAYSHFWHERRNHPEALRAFTFAEALDWEPFLLHSKYGVQFEAWIKHFSREQIFVLLDNDLKEDPRAAIRSVYRFLDVDASFEPPSLERRINPPHTVNPIGRTARMAAVQARRLGLGRIIEVAKRWRVDKLVDMVGTSHRPYPPMDPADARRARALLSSDIERFEELIGRPLESWKEQTL